MTNHEEEDMMDSQTMQGQYLPPKLGQPVDPRHVDRLKAKRCAEPVAQEPSQLPPRTDWRGEDKSSDELKQQRH